VDERVSEAEDVVLIMDVPRVIKLEERIPGQQLATRREGMNHHQRTNSNMVTSIILWLKYAGLFLTTLTATISCVFIF
jgi:hypothetical protein